MKPSTSDNQRNNDVFSEEEYKNIPLNRDNILKLLKLANKKALSGALIGIGLVTIGSLLTDKELNIKRVIRRPYLLLPLFYSLRRTPTFIYFNSLSYTILTEILPIITKWSLLKSDLIAGLMTGWIISLDTHKQQAFVSLWGLSSFVQAMCSVLHKENILRIPYGAQLIFSSAVAQMFYSLLYHPLSLSASELRSLRSIIPLGSIKSLFTKNESEGSDPTLFEIVTNNKSGEQFDSLCSHSHSRDISCARNSLNSGVHFAKENYAYFFLISFLPTLIVDFKSIKKRPFLVIASKLMNLCQTLSTISLASTLLNYQACKSSWSQSTRKNPNPLRHLSIIQAFLVGLFTSWLPTSRRLLYFNSVLGMSSITSLYNILRKKGLIFKIPFFFPILYSTFYNALLAIMRNYPGVLTPTMIFGCNSFFPKERILKPNRIQKDNDQVNQINRAEKDHKYNNID